MYLKMGTRDMVVASNPDAARAFLKTRDLNFSNRPIDGGPTHLAYNAQDMVFADYGPRWKLLRKLSNLHMLGGKALEDWAPVRVTELGHMLRAMCEASRKGDPVVVPEMLTYAMANMIGQIILSRRVFVTKGSESNEFKDMVVELMTSAGFFNIGDFIPSVAWMDLQGIERGMKKLHRRFDVLLTKMIEDHSATSHERKGKPDFLDVLMANQENSDGARLCLTNIKALLLVSLSLSLSLTHTHTHTHVCVFIQDTSCTFIMHKYGLNSMKRH
jgi:flavonoid 3',5'-hydroxylase